MPGAEARRQGATARPQHAFSLDLGGGIALRLRELHHVPEYRALVEANQEHLQPWFPSFAPLLPEDAEARTRAALGLFAEGTGWEADLCEWGEPVGVIRLHRRSEPGGSSEVGYWLDAAHQGRGLVTKAVAGVLSYLFDGFGVGHVSLVTDTRNERSMRVAERLGFKPEAVLRRATLGSSGEPADQAHFGLLREEHAATALRSPGATPQRRFSLVVDDELELAIPEREDAEAISALAERNVEQLLPWMPWARSISPAAQREFIVNRALPALQQGDGFEAMILERGELVGGAGIHDVSPERRRGQIGYWLDAERYGHGVVTRTARAILARSFESDSCAGNPFERMEIRADARNLRSRAVAERLGFTFEGVLRRDTFHGAGYGDMAVYGLLRQEWLARRG